MILIYACTRWSDVCLLSARNMTFVWLLTQIIRLRTQFLGYAIKIIHLDNVSKFIFMPSMTIIFLVIDR